MTGATLFSINLICTPIQVLLKNSFNAWSSGNIAYQRWGEKFMPLDNWAKKETYSK